VVVVQTMKVGMGVFGDLCSAPLGHSRGVLATRATSGQSGSDDGATVRVGVDFVMRTRIEAHFLVRRPLDPS
jgi:hypothetical protein